MKRIRMAKYGYILISVIFYISGILYMALPDISSLFICIASGCILLAYGVIKIVGYFSDDLYCLAFQYDLACGTLLVIVGSIVLEYNLRLRQFLSPGLGLLILIDALLRIQTSKDAKKFGLKNWYRILILSVIAGIFGILIIIKPFLRMKITYMINGWGLLAEGLMNHLLVMETVKVMNSKPERN